MLVKNYAKIRANSYMIFKRKDRAKNEIIPCLFTSLIKTPFSYITFPKSNLSFFPSFLHLILYPHTIHHKHSLLHFYPSFLPSFFHSFLPSFYTFNHSKLPHHNHFNTLTHPHLPKLSYNTSIISTQRTDYDTNYHTTRQRE